MSSHVYDCGALSAVSIRLVLRGVWIGGSAGAAGAYRVQERWRGGVENPK